MELAGGTWLASHFIKPSGAELASDTSALRCVNVVNFMRGDEPRLPMDLMLPVEKQMEVMIQRNLPATWLMQYDALVTGKWTTFLKANMPKTHEVGFWFEMNELLCKAAGVKWRGRPGYEWDSQPSVAFSIGYTPEERIKLADQAMKGFQEIWGQKPKSVASWNLDSILIEHLVKAHGVQAFAICRDQIATDGFTVWGAPIAGYYPSRKNCLSPAIARSNQIAAPIFRMLGQDPIHYYEVQYQLPDGTVLNQPDTMEPVWTSGQDPRFVDEFFKMISQNPCGEFAYVQLGQENNFGWPRMAKGYEMQMEKLVQLREAGHVHVETMGESGQRFKKAFAQTPVQMQVQVNDPFPTKAGDEQTFWYQSRFYRANLNIKDGVPYLRDIMVYADAFEQLFLNEPTTQDEVDQRALAVMDGYHWKRGEEAGTASMAGGIFATESGMLRMNGLAGTTSTSETLNVELPLSGECKVELRFEPKTIEIICINGSSEFKLSFRWNPSAASFIKVEGGIADFKYQGFSYRVKVLKGKAIGTESGWDVKSETGRVKLLLAQE